jgi:hypothetical protein
MSSSFCYYHPLPSGPVLQVRAHVRLVLCGCQVALLLPEVVVVRCRSGLTVVSRGRIAHVHERG